MANTYTQLYAHIIYVVSKRDCVITNKLKNELYKYITGIIKNNKHTMIVINGMPDHVHMLIGMHPNQSVSDLLKKVKGNSSKWINEKNFTVGKFSWQAGFAAFSVSQSQINKVTDYIRNQEYHHKLKSFREEYIELMKAYNLEFDTKYIFDDIQ